MRKLREWKNWLAEHDTEEAFRYVSWAPSFAFMSIYLGSGDFAYFSIAAAFAIWPVMRAFQQD